MTVLDREKIQRAMKAAEAEQAFWEAHYQDYLKQYPDEFVAVRDGAVVATTADLEQLILALQEKGFAPTDVWVYFVAAHPQQVSL